MSELVPPHGSESLKPLLLEAGERAEVEARLAGLKIVPMSSREVSDLLMLGMGAYTPLDGFMGHDDWCGACAEKAGRHAVVLVHATLPDALAGLEVETGQDAFRAEGEDSISVDRGR